MPAGEEYSGAGENLRDPNCLRLLAGVVYASLKVFIKTKLLSLSIFTLTTLPLSLLNFIFFFITHRVKTRIRHLEGLSLFSPVKVESEHVLSEANFEAKRLFFVRVVFLLPCFVLSFFAAVSSVNAAALVCSSGIPTGKTVVSAVKTAWKRLLATTMCVYVFMLACTVIPGTLMAFLNDKHHFRAIVTVIGSGIELHLMAVTSLALVVSINEGRYGFDAMWFGSVLMEGRRVCGWALSGLFILLSGFISWKMESSINDFDWLGIESTVVITWLWDNVGWICFYAWVVQWSYVVTTVFYFDCKKRDTIKSDGEISLTIV